MWIIKGRWKVALIMVIVWVVTASAVIIFLPFENLMPHYYFDNTRTLEFWFCFWILSFPFIMGVVIYMSYLPVFKSTSKKLRYACDMRTASSIVGLSFVVLSFLLLTALYLTVVIDAAKIIILVIVYFFWLAITTTYFLAKVAEKYVNSNTRWK
ncbi:MAG: hypothetical protein FWC52_02315 [Candidatus Methanoplasma sp.]|nr:hypothetical protein [Candidatus Methanoplasma sp.]